MKLKHNIKLLEYKHYQVKDMKLKHNIKLLEYKHYQVKDMKLKHNIKLLEYYVLVSCLLLGSVYTPAVLCYVLVSCLLLGSVYTPAVLCYVLVSCLLLGSVYIPAVLCYVIVLTCSSICADLEDSLGKEQLYRRKIKKNHVSDYYCSNYEIIFIQLYWIIKKNYMQIYIFMKK
jgi:hypothetical protein